MSVYGTNRSARSRRLSLKIYLEKAARRRRQAVDEFRRSQTSDAELIDRLITHWPECPKFISLIVDRISGGDKGLAAAVEKELVEAGL